MTGRTTTLVQARVSAEEAAALDDDARVLGYQNRSEAVRAAMRLLHHRARHEILTRDYDRFYGPDTEAPMGDLTAMGDQLAAESLVPEQPTD